VRRELGASRLGNSRDLRISVADWPATHTAVSGNPGKDSCGVAVEAADPTPEILCEHGLGRRKQVLAALAFCTTLQPAIFLRNASASAYTAQVTFNWRSGTTTGKSTTAVPLQPYATNMVDVAALQAQGTIPASAQWAYVSVTAPIQPDSLLAVAASYDATGKLGAQTPFSDQVANHWEGGKWEVDANHNTIIAVGNAGITASKAQITFYYNSGQGKYQVEQDAWPRRGPAGDGAVTQQSALSMSRITWGRGPRPRVVLGCYNSAAWLNRTPLRMASSS